MSFYVTPVKKPIWKEQWQKEKYQAAHESEKSNPYREYNNKRRSKFYKVAGSSFQLRIAAIQIADTFAKICASGKFLQKLCFKKQQYLN